MSLLILTGSCRAQNARCAARDFYDTGFASIQRTMDMALGQVSNSALVLMFQLWHNQPFKAKVFLLGSFPEPQTQNPLYHSQPFYKKQIKSTTQLDTEIYGNIVFVLLENISCIDQLAVSYACILFCR